MAVKKGGRNMPKKEHIKGTLTIFAPSLIKDAAHTIVIPGMLSYIDFYIDKHPYLYTHQVKQKKIRNPMSFLKNFLTRKFWIQKSIQ